MPEFLHAELDTMLGSHAGDFDLLGWYVETDKKRQRERPVVFSGLHFWRDELRAAMRARGWLPTKQRLIGPPPIPTTREEWACPHTPHCLHRTPCQRLSDLAAAKASA